ncbi:hypothetical protein KA005_15355, partial [bacterium]|nr:hypothetical protein [bacterium]
MTFYAYIEPGSVSYIFQLIIGALIGGLFAARVFWNKIKIFFKKKRKTPKKEKKIVFYTEHQGYYPYFEGLIKKLINDYNQTLCYV